MAATGEIGIGTIQQTLTVDIRTSLGFPLLIVPQNKRIANLTSYVVLNEMVLSRDHPMVVGGWQILRSSMIPVSDTMQSDDARVTCSQLQRRMNCNH